MRQASPDGKSIAKSLAKIEEISHKSRRTDGNSPGPEQAFLLLHKLAGGTYYASELRSLSICKMEALLSARAFVRIKRPKNCNRFDPCWAAGLVCRRSVSSLGHVGASWARGSSRKAAAG